MYLSKPTGYKHLDISSQSYVFCETIFYDFSRTFRFQKLCVIDVLPRFLMFYQVTELQT